MATFAGWEMREGAAELVRACREVPALSASDALVRVAGCGVCHTDLGFLYDGVRTRHALPLILGHEISGYVEDAGSAHRGLVGRAVVVPAVLPCGECAACRSGRSTICPRQIMPGNDRDGGFAERVVLPARFLCPVPGAGANPDAPLGRAPGLTLRHLAVVADAVSTAYQAVERSGASEGTIAVVVGLGGVGGYAAQIAADRGAAVVAVDVDARRREEAARRGAAMALDPRELPGKELRARVFALAKERGAPATGWTILECSGTPAGQQTAFGLLVHGATLMVVGFTLEPVSLRLSNLMAFDARALGNWGCAPELYPAILEKVLDGRIDVVSPTTFRPMSRIGEALEDVHARRADRRIVLVPDQEEP